jgi:tetratricopeptide (TPR) repeat protein
MSRNRSRRPAPARTGPRRSSLERRWWAVLAALFLIAFLWRLGYVVRLGTTPLGGSLRSDEQIYWDWATFLLDHHFRGTNPFFLGPLYPYVLAFVRAVAGSQVGTILVVQALWGAAAVALLADAARRVSRPSLSLGLGLVLAVYEMGVFFDGLILMESLLFFLEALLLWLWCRAAMAPRRAIAFIVIGLVTGLVAECRAIGALLLVPDLVVAARSGTATPASRVARLAGMTAAFLLMTIPAAAWNWSVSREFIPFTYNLGFNLYVGNNPEADGGFVSVTGPRQVAPVELAQADGGVVADGRAYLKKVRHLTLSAGQSSTYWAHQALAFMRAHPGTTLALAGKKLLLLFNHRETPQIERPSLFRHLAGPMGVPVLGSFLLVGILGLVGLGCAGSAPTLTLGLRLYVALMAAGLIPFFVTDRYRVHLVPALALLAVLALESLMARCRTRPRASLRCLTWTALGAGALVTLPLVPSERAFDDWLAARDLGIRWLEKGRPDLAAPALGRAIQLERSLQLEADPDPQVAQQRAESYYNYAVARRHNGDEDGALIWLRAAAEAQPENARYVRTLGDAYLVHGRVQEGDSLLRRVSGLVGGEGEALLSEGWRAAREGRLERAEDLFQRAARSDTRLFGAWLALIRVQVERGELDRARETLGRAAEAGVPAYLVDAHQALVQAALGNEAAARSALAKVPASAIAADPTLTRLVARVERLLARPR